MTTINIKENRYDLIKKSLQNRLIQLREDLAYDLGCDSDKISDAEWEDCVTERLKKPLDDFWGKEDVAYYLFDKLIEENACIPSYPPNQIKKYLNDWQI